MLDNLGRPQGYDQVSPYLDAARPQAGQSQTPLQTAVQGGVPNYAPDPTLVGWRKREQDFNRAIGGRAPSTTSLLDAENDLRAAGFSIHRNAAGVPGKVVDHQDNDRVVDILRNAGLGGDGWQFHGPMAPGGKGNSNSLMAAMLNGMRTVQPTVPQEDTNSSQVHKQLVYQMLGSI